MISDDVVGWPVSGDDVIEVCCLGTEVGFGHGGWASFGGSPRLLRKEEAGHHKKSPEGFLGFSSLAPRPGLEPGTYGLTERKSVDHVL